MDMWNQEEARKPLRRKEINLIRHLKERGIYTFAVLVNIILFVILFSWLISEMSTFYQKLQAMAQEQNIAISELDTEAIKKVFETAWYHPKNQMKIQIFFYVSALVLFTVFILEYFYARVRAKAIRVTPDQFSEIYDLAVEYAHFLGLKKIPEIYLAQENGILNAFASNIIRRRFIQINIDLLEIAYRQHHDLASIGFVLAHEMAHIKLRHVSIWIRYTVLLSQVIPIIGPVLSRVREYSCDRLAQVVSGNDGVEAMMALAMGKHLYKKTNVENYMESSKKVKGFWIWIVNLSSSHPILPKRVRALMNPSVHGKLF